MVQIGQIAMHMSYLWSWMGLLAQKTNYFWLDAQIKAESREIATALGQSFTYVIEDHKTSLPEMFLQLIEPCLKGSTPVYSLNMHKNRLIMKDLASTQPILPPSLDRLEAIYNGTFHINQIVFTSADEYMLKLMGKVRSSGPETAMIIESAKFNCQLAPPSLERPELPQLNSNISTLVLTRLEITGAAPPDLEQFLNYIALETPIQSLYVTHVVNQALSLSCFEHVNWASTSLLSLHSLSLDSLNLASLQSLLNRTAVSLKQITVEEITGGQSMASDQPTPCTMLAIDLQLFLRCSQVGLVGLIRIDRLLVRVIIGLEPPKEISKPAIPIWIHCNTLSIEIQRTAPCFLAGIASIDNMPDIFFQHGVEFHTHVLTYIQPSASNWEDDDCASHIKSSARTLNEWRPLEHGNHVLRKYPKGSQTIFYITRATIALHMPMAMNAIEYFINLSANSICSSLHYHMLTIQHDDCKDLSEFDLFQRTLFVVGSISGYQLEICNITYCGTAEVARHLYISRLSCRVFYQITVNTLVLNNLSSLAISFLYEIYQINCRRIKLRKISPDDVNCLLSYINQQLARHGAIPVIEIEEYPWLGEAPAHALEPFMAHSLRYGEVRAILNQDMLLMARPPPILAQMKELGITIVCQMNWGCWTEWMLRYDIWLDSPFSSQIDELSITNVLFQRLRSIVTEKRRRQYTASPYSCFKVGRLSLVCETNTPGILLADAHIKIALQWMQLYFPQVRHLIIYRPLITEDFKNNIQHVLFQINSQSLSLQALDLNFASMPHDCLEECDIALNIAFVRKITAPSIYNAHLQDLPPARMFVINRHVFNQLKTATHHQSMSVFNNKTNSTGAYPVPPFTFFNLPALEMFVQRRNDDGIKCNQQDCPNEEALLSDCLECEKEQKPCHPTHQIVYILSCGHFICTMCFDAVQSPQDIVTPTESENMPRDGLDDISPPELSTPSTASTSSNSTNPIQPCGICRNFKEISLADCIFIVKTSPTDQPLTLESFSLCTVQHGLITTCSPLVAQFKAILKSLSHSY
ncbi:hypothetical protein NEHOM01_1654 [Nematocida homosporus]|uniref:uncharacterized protein n=1 Tax=Nematocida homosporus TaxID=1912981 RepID=UPI002220DD9C|nr:uncharacterized protein NEHOM01_1654 [Nematocida homosporus]KAI5186715.1 hypothetical protein NEHOM01_1654 [Nematocida homosporus]